MTLPTTSLAIFDLLAADTTLTGLLGTHKLKSGATRPALAHLWETETIEQTTQQFGVEIVVKRGPMATAMAPAHDGGGAQNPTFRLVVTQFRPSPRTGPYHLDAVLNRLQQLLPGANSNNVTVQGLTTGLSQFVLTWTSVTAAL
jgi:hypothetical protein